MKDFTSPNTWEEEIRKKALKASIYNAKLIRGMIILLFLIGIVILNILNIIEVLYIEDTVIKTLNAFSAIFAILFSLKVLIPIRDVYTSKEGYYRSAAYKIIEELSKKGKIKNTTKEETLMDKALKNLGAVEPRSNHADAEGKLKKACSEMAEIYKDGKP
jgi:hypothetical protein